MCVRTGMREQDKFAEDIPGGHGAAEMYIIVPKSFIFFLARKQALHLKLLLLGPENKNFMGAWCPFGQ